MVIKRSMYESASQTVHPDKIDTRQGHTSIQSVFVTHEKLPIFTLTYPNISHRNNSK